MIIHRPEQIQPHDDPARMIAEHGQGGVRLAIVAAMAALIDSLDPAALSSAIEQHRFDALWRHLAIERLIQSLRPALNRLAVIHDRSAISASIGIAESPMILKARPSRLKTPAVIHLTYDPLDTATVAAQNATGDAIAANIAATTQSTIETIIADGLSAGQRPAQIARRLRDAFGLSVPEANAIANYRAALEGDPAAALTRALRDPRFDAAVRRGDLPPERIERMIARYGARYRSFRANRLALTESLRAANQGRLAAWKQFADRSGEEIRRFWLTAGDELVCGICSPIPSMNRDGIALDEQYDTPIGPISSPPDPHPLCLPGDVLIEARAPITGHTARWFDDDIAVIRTAAGKQLPVTLNHPVLTTRGWIAPCLLVQGDHLICDGIADRRPLSIDDHQGMPSRIGEVSDALRRSGQMATREVPLTAKDFHGDGRDGEIAVIGAYRHLRNRLQLSRHQQIEQGLFKHGLDLPRFRDGGRHVDLSGDRNLRATDTVMRRAREVLSLAWGHSRMTAQHAVAAIGNIAAGLLQMHFDSCACQPVIAGYPFDRSASFQLSDHGVAINDTAKRQFGGAVVERATQSVVSTPHKDRRSTDAEMACDILEGRHGVVHLDQVINVARVPFRGHVFNLETDSHHYLAHGIYVHNCRCTERFERTGGGT